MKQLLFALALTCSSLSYAQPAITTASFNPIAGDYYHYRVGYITDSLVLPSIEASGAGVTWNYATLFSVYNSYGQVYNSSSTPYSDSFPTANIAIYSRSEGPFGIDTGYNYWIANDSVCKQIGNYDINNNTFGYQTYTSFKFPMHYGDAYTDSNIMASTSSGAPYAIETHPAVVDAYGTLILPTGTYPNTLRLKISELNFTRYYWIAPYAHLPLLYAGIETSATSTIPASTEFSYTTAVLTSISDARNNLSFSFFPNPATDEIKLAFETPTVKEATITVVDATGNVVGTYKTAGSITTIKTADLASGMYLLKVQTGEAQAIQKFSVIH